MLIESFPQRAVNIHPSLLPKYRGPAPIQHALLNGDSEAGVSIIEVHPERFDHGSILKQGRCAIDSVSTMSKVSLELADLGGELLLQVLRDLPGHRQRSISQDGSDGTKAPKLSPKERFIGNWSNVTMVFNKYRVFEQLNCYYKSAKTHQVVSLYDLSQPTKLFDKKGAYGDVLLSKDRTVLFIRCGEEHEWLPVKRLQLEGKSAVSPNEFYNGYLLRKNKSESGVIEDVFA